MNHITTTNPEPFDERCAVIVWKSGQVVNIQGITYLEYLTDSNASNAPARFLFLKLKASSITVPLDTVNAIQLFDAAALSEEAEKNDVTVKDILDALNMVYKQDK